MFKTISPELQKINKPSNLRVEISFSRLPEHWNKNLGKQLRSTINYLLETNVFFTDVKLNFVDIDCFVTIHIRKKENKIRFSDGWILLGDNENQLECNYFISDASCVDNAFKRQIKDALAQLPDDYTKHVFVELLPGMVVDNIIKLLNTMTISHDVNITLYKEEVEYNKLRDHTSIFIELKRRYK